MREGRAGRGRVGEGRVRMTFKLEVHNVFATASVTSMIFFFVFEQCDRRRVRNSKSKVLHKR